MLLSAQITKAFFVAGGEGILFKAKEVEPNVSELTSSDLGGI
jgi:hypothetical protein